MICSSLTLPIRSGSGLNAFNLAKEFFKKGYYVTHLSYNWGFKYKMKEYVQGVKIIRMPLWQRDFNDAKIKFLLSLPLIIIAFVKEAFSVDLIIIFGTLRSFRLVLLLILLAKLLRKSIVFRSTMVGADDLHSILTHYSGFLNRKILSKIDGYYSISPAFTEAYLKHFTTKEKVLETFQGVDIAKFRPVSLEEKNSIKVRLSLPTSIPVIISVGYVHARKGYQAIFDVLANIKISFLYLIIGQFDDNFNPALTTQEKNGMNRLYNYGQASLKDKILFLGEKSNISTYMQASDILLINSLQEGVPNVLLEGMACGLGVATKRLPGVDQFLTISGKNAEVFDTDLQMSEAVSRLLTEERYRQKIGKCAYHTIQSQYSLSAVANRIINEFLI